MTMTEASYPRVEAGDLRRLQNVHDKIPLALEITASTAYGRVGLISLSLVTWTLTVEEDGAAGYDTGTKLVSRAQQ